MTSTPDPEPLVTVVIPCFNVAPYLSATLQSVSAQTFRHFEVLMVNDGSTDDTLSIMQACAAQDKRFRTINLPKNRGIVVARNEALAQARGEYIALLDGDDLWTPDALTQRVGLAQRNPTVAVIATDFAWFTDAPAAQPVGRVGLGPRAKRAFADSFSTSQPVLLKDPFDLVATTHFAWVGATLIRRDAMASIGNFNPAFKGPEDTLLWLRLANCQPFLFAPQITAFYRQRAGSIVGAYTQPKEHYYIKVLDWVRGRPEFSKRLPLINTLTAECDHICALHYRRYGDTSLGWALALAAVRRRPTESRYWRGLAATGLDRLRRQLRKPAA